MTRELARQFSEEVEQYRRAMLYFAARCDWEEFKARAARLFEYVETVETAERERRFFAVFNSVLALLAAGVLIAFGIGPGMPAALNEYRDLAVVLSLAGFGFELFFYMNFRTYVAARMAGLHRRRQAFIRNIENDFRSFTAQPQTSRG